MAKEKIAEKILKDAQEKVKEIERAIEEEKQKLIEQYENELKELEMRAREEADALKNREVERIVLLEEMKERNKLLQAKREALERVFEEALHALNALDGEKYKNFVLKLVENYVEPKTGEIVFSDLEKVLSIKDFNRPGWNFQESPEKHTGFKGIMVKQGKRVINLTFDYLLNLLKNEIESEVAGVLFGNG